MIRNGEIGPMGPPGADGKIGPQGYAGAPGEKVSTENYFVTCIPTNCN